jgi:eukaryotic-like serine/threonine-protein kinase
VPSTGRLELLGEGSFSYGKRLVDRFVIEQRLGAGGMGVVYEAFDEQRRERVALKTLGRVDGASLYRLKKEFRALADLVHPNLVRLHELFFDEEVGCFFTMARVEGRPFLSYVRGGETSEEAVLDDTAPVSALVRPRELRLATIALAHGVEAIHRAGKIHRDLKPANVLVSREGHVTILDFGLVEPTSSDAERSIDLAGTPGYMAPEQLRRGGACAASDWYAVGVMLYQALSGRLPHVGATPEVIAAKLAGLPIAPLETVPADLQDIADLASALLDATPEARPTGEDVLRRLDACLADDAHSVPGSWHRRFGLIGRSDELAVLHAAYEEMRKGETRTVWVEGTSGIGKSALVEHFVSELRWRGSSSETLVLSGRCYERESVPFKALDAVVDALSRHLARLDRVRAARMTPRDLEELCRTFPVLGRVAVFAEGARTRGPASDPEVVRRRAFLALKELLYRVADERPLVITIDDLQWGDVDSGFLLSQLVSPPDPPCLMLVGTYRTEDVERSPLLRLLREQARLEAQKVQTVSLAPLDETASAELAREYGASEEELAHRIAIESGGSPFFIAELTRASATKEAPSTSVAEVVAARVERLPADAKRLLETVAVAGGPVPRRAALRAAGLDPHDDGAVPVLRSAMLLRATADALETYHDRIRGVVATSVARERARSIHLALAEALEALPDTSPDVLYTHYLEGGRKETARQHGLAAARRARDVFAFDRAAALYRSALELVPPADTGEAMKLTRELADALALAGKGDEAADAYLRAAKEATNEEEVIDLERSAATELLSRGDLDRGLALVDGVARRLGVWIPQSTLVSILSGCFVLLFFFWRGIRIRGRREPPDSRARRKIDVLFRLALGLGMIETARAVLLLSQVLLGTVRARDRSRLPIALWSAALVANGFLRTGHPRIAAWMAQGEELARDADPDERDSHRATQHYFEGFIAFMGGRWRRAHDAGNEAERLLERLPGRSSELHTVRSFGAWSLYYLGELRAHAERCMSLSRDARARGNLLLLNAMVNTWGPLVHLARDDVATAKRETEDAFAAWPGKRFQLQHYWNMLAHGCIDLYAGEGERLHERFEREWPAVRGSRILYSPLMRMQLVHLRGAACLAAAESTSEPERRRALLRSAGQHANEIARLTVAGSPELAGLIAAGVARVSGDDTLARERLASALEGFERAEMRGYAMAARRHLGMLRRGDEGRELVAEADAFFEKEGVMKPERYAAMLAPGFG